MPFKDRTNIKYGKLTAIEYLGKSMWKCQCDCGNEKIVYGGHLESGHTKSCGCFRPPRINLMDQHFGRLTPIEWLGDGKWNCRCVCGNVVPVLTYNLQNGNTQSCGCLQKERAGETSFKSLVGERFGKLLVVERVKNNRFGHICYKCKCDCGGETVVDATNLRHGTTNSCGCLKSKGEMLINNWLQDRNIPFQSQYSIDEIILESGRRPFFDFAIFNNNNQLLCLIEYNGKQHYKVTGGWNTEEALQITQNRDKQKRDWCEKLHIPLYVISYQDEIDKEMEKIMNGLDDEDTAAETI